MQGFFSPHSGQNLREYALGWKISKVWLWKHELVKGTAGTRIKSSGPFRFSKHSGEVRGEGEVKAKDQKNPKHQNRSEMMRG